MARQRHGHELAGIEVMRFLCAFGVLVWHYQHFFFSGEWQPEVSLTLRPHLPLYPALAFFYENGSLAVPFFWVISGFIFYWHYAKPIEKGIVTFPDFVSRRFSRLYPLHFATLIVVAVEQYLYYRSHQATFIYSWNKPTWFVSHLLFASNWLARAPTTFNGPIWSVSIEILIYLAFFAVMRALRPGIVSAACIAAAFAACFNWGHWIVNTQVFACGMYFFAGGVAQQLAKRRATFSIAACVVVAVSIVLGMGWSSSNSPLLLLLATGSVIIFTRLGETLLEKPFRRLAFLGNATYSSYLLHFPMQLTTVLVVDACGWRREIFFSPVCLLMYLGVVVGTALLVYHYFEMPAQALIRTAARSRVVPSGGLRSVSQTNSE